MQDGQFSQTLTNPTPEYKPVYFEPQYSPIRTSLGGVGIKDNPELYEDIKIADQSGFKNWLNTFIQGVNETQVGIGASDLMDGLVKKANLETKLHQLDAQYTLGSMNQGTYLTQKNQLLTDLQDAYGSIQSARESIYEDKQDEAKRPISRAYQQKTNLTMLQGSNASLLDEFKYSLPNVLGSSFATLGATLASGFIGKVASKAVQGAISGTVGGPWGTVLGLATGLGTVFGINAYARNLESKAEVGSQFLQDYDELRSQFLTNKPAGYQLSDDEDNKLILQASAGSQDQYWKNMSLALSDSIQSLIMAGVVGKAFRGATNINKFSRLAGIGAEFYATKKLEGLEEGLQYAFQTDKSLAARGLKDPNSLGVSLFRNYGDVTGSMSLFGLQGKGRFAEDPEFQANINAGELLGGIFSGIHTMTSIVKDVNSYRKTTAELAQLNPTKTEAPVLKFKDELYAQFFGPKDRGGLGLFSDDAEDRAFFFKEGLKTLSKKTFEDGTPLLTKEELAKELKNVDEAFEMYQDINKNIDALISPFGKEAKVLTRLQKVAFRDELFHNTMALSRLKDLSSRNQMDMMSTMDAGNVNDVSRTAAQLSVVEERLKNAFGNYEEYLTKSAKDLNKLLNEQLETNRSLSTSTKISIVDQDTTKAINDFYDSEETKYDYEKKRKGLAKVKNWSDLQTWFSTYKKTAPESFLKKQEEAIVTDNKAFAEGLLKDRKPLSDLTGDDKKARTKQNKDVLLRAGFTKNYVGTLGEDDLDTQATKALEEFRSGVANVTEENLLSVILSAENKDELLTYLSRPSIRAAFNRASLDINADLATLQAKAKTRLNELQEEQRKNKVRVKRPEGLDERTGSLLVSGRVKSKIDSRESEDYATDFGIKDGKAQQKDVLEGIINSNFATEPDKELARKLLSITKDEDQILFRANWRPTSKADERVFDNDGQPVNGDTNGLVRRPGTYSSDGTVVIDLAHFGDEIQGNQQSSLAPAFESTVLHELIHKYTLEAVRDSPEIKAKIQDMILKVKQALAGNLQNAIDKKNLEKYKPENYYGLKNPYEFVAEAMTSPDFQKLLASVEGEGNKSIWQNFIDAVTSLLKSLFNIEISGSLLEDAISLTSNIIDGKKGPGNVSAFIEKMNAKIGETLGAIDVTAKDAEDALNNAVNNLQSEILYNVNENELGDVIKQQLLDNLFAKGNELQKKIEDNIKEGKKIVFQGKEFDRGSYVAVKGYAEPFFVKRSTGLALIVSQKKDNVTRDMSIKDVDDIEFNSDLSKTREFIEKRDAKPEDVKYKNNNSPHLYKSIGQQFDDRTGKFVEDTQPVTQRFYDFLAFAKLLGVAKLGYRAMLVKDDDAVAGFAIPRDKDTEEHLKTKKPGEVVVIVDRNGNPVKFDKNFTPANDGEYVVFNIETSRRILDRNTRMLAEQRGITIEQAERLKVEVAQNVAQARKSAAEGKPVFLDIKAIFIGVDVNTAVLEVESSPISIPDAERVVRLLNYLTGLSADSNEKASRIKDFLFDYIIGKTEGSYISGGEIFINNEKVTRPSEIELIDNFEYKKAFGQIANNNPYQLLDVNNGKIFTSEAFPTYTSYLQTVTNLGSDITQSRYNRYLTYEFSEQKKGKDVETLDPATNIKTIEKDKPFDEGNIFDSVLSDLDELEKEKINFKGLLGESYKNIPLQGETLNDLISQALDNKETVSRALGEKAVGILYNLASFKQVLRAYNNKLKLSDTNGLSDLEKLLEDKSSGLDSVLSTPLTSNELGLFDNQTTYELVKTLDKGIHNYLRKTGVKTIIGALEDRDFVIKALEQTKISMLQRLNQLKDLRATQLEGKKFGTDYYENQIKLIDHKINSLNKDWDKIVNYYFRNSEVFAFAHDLHYKYDEQGNLVQEGDDRVARERGFDRVGNEVSPIDGASKEVKALIRGLSKFKKINNEWTQISNSWNAPDLVTFAPTWNNLLKNFQGTSTFEEMLTRLTQLQTKFPEYGELLEILNGYYDKKGNYIDGYYQKAKGGDVESLIMIAKFNRDFGNPEIPIYEVLAEFGDDGTVFKINEATRKNVKDIKKLALDNFRHKSKFAAKTKLGNIGLSNKILDLPTITRAERAEFLKGLGLEISESTLKDPMFDIVASQQIIRYIKDEIRIIMKHRSIQDPIVDISRQTEHNRGQSKRINDIIALESKYSQSAPTLSMQNVEGNTEYAISRPNFYSLVIRGLNNIAKYPTFQVLVADPQFEFLNKPYARTSLVLNTIFVLDSDRSFGSRRFFDGKPVKLSLTNISGLEVQDGDGNKTTSLFIGDKLVQDFNQLLKSGSKELMRAGDKKASFGLRVSTFYNLHGRGVLPIADLSLFKGSEGYGGEQLTSIMEKYLHGEIMRIYLGRNGYMNDIRKMISENVHTSIAHNASLFQGLLTTEQKSDLYAEIETLKGLEPGSKELYDQTALIAKNVISRPDVMYSIRKFFFNEVKAKQESLNKYGFAFKDRWWLDKSFKDHDAGTLLRAYIVNEFILHVEQTKLFSGDIAFYSTKDGEAHKRLPAFGATGVAPITDPWFADALNHNENTNLQSKHLGVNNQYSNVIKTVVFRESVPRSIYTKNWRAELKSRGLSNDEINRIVGEYEKGSKEADAQGWITMDYYRSFKISIGDWRLSQERVYDKVSKGQALTTEEVESLGRLFPPVKAQYSGPVMHDYYHVPAFHKFSLLPLLPSAIKGTALESLNERMIRNNVSYALMETGSKVGTIGSALEPFYENTGKRTMKAPTSAFDNINMIHGAYVKEQVQIEPELHTEVIFGTQFRKLLFQNVYSNGKPANKKLADLEKEYSDLIDEITNYERDKLTQDMGVEPVFKATDKGDIVTDYVIKDQSKLLNRIREEVKRRKLNNSIKDFFELKDGKLKYPLDASLNHQQVRTLILSMINNRLIRQTIKGDMLVQGSGLGFEKFNKVGTDDQLEYGTNGLRFYHVAGGKVRKMQVKTALTGDFKHLLNFNWNGDKISTLERLNQALKDSKWVEEHSKMITMIGYRIPTQGLNSIEVMEVAEFLPPESGAIVIVPTEIVTKAGSDFDIDKLNVFKPSLRTVKGEGEYIARTEYKGTKKDIKDSIDPQITDLQAKKEAFKLFSDLNEDEKEKFFEQMKDKLEITDKTLVEQLANVGQRLKELDRLIAESQQRVENFTTELRANYDPDLNEVLMAEKAYQMDLKIDLADELDKVGELKKNLLLQKFAEQDLSKASDLLDAMYDQLFGERTKFNAQIDSQIQGLIEDRRKALDQVANYKFGLFNRLIEVASERLTDPASFEELITPNSTDLIKPTVNEISSAAGTSKKPYLHTNNLTSSTQEEKFLAGIPNKKSLGIAAVANTMAQLFEKVGLQVNHNFAKHVVTHPMIKNLDMSNRHLVNGTLKSEVISQMINAYVDVLNDDFISKANLSLDTAGAFFYLLHLSHDSDQLFYFFNHPVIKSYIEGLQKTKSILRIHQDMDNIEREGKENNIEIPLGDLESIAKSRAKQEAYRDVIGFGERRDVKALKNIGLTILAEKPSILDKDRLKEAVGKPLDEISKDERMAILGYYLNVLEESGELLKLQQVNNYDTTTSVNPVANEFREALKTELQQGHLFNTTDVTTGTVIKPFNQFTLISNILEALMPVSLNADVRKAIVTLLEDQKLQGDVDKLTRVFINDWVYSIAVNLGETANGQRIGDYGKNLLFKTGEDSRLASVLLDLKLNAKWENLRRDFPMIDLLRVDTYNTISNIALYREDNSTEYQNSLIEQFYKLGNFDEIGYTDEEKLYVKKFFRDLAVLSFTQSGLNKSPISFSDVIPNEFYTPIMTKAIKKFQDLTPQQRGDFFNKFAAKFRGQNTNLFGREPNYIPYWRFKDYMFEDTSGQAVQGTLPFTGDPSSGNPTLVKDFKTMSEVAEAEKRGEGINTLRKQGTNEHFGNPFTGSDKGVGTIQMKSIPDAVNAYITWLSDPKATFTDKFGKSHTNVKPEQRQWILDQINSGALDGKHLLYYKPSNYYSHADALAKFINTRSRDKESFDSILNSDQKRLYYDMPDGTFQGLLKNLEAAGLLSRVCK